MSKEKAPDPHQNLQYLASNISISGVKFILGKDATPVRRLVWFLFLVGAVTWMAWNIGQQVALFISRPTSVTTTLTVSDVIAFPQVVVCNQNSVRSSSMFALNGDTMRSPSVYEALVRYFRLLNDDVRTMSATTTDRKNNTDEEMMKSGDVSDFVSKYGGLLRDMKMNDLMQSAAQDKLTFIQSCKWRGRNCGHDNFVNVLTNQGVCYKFAPDDTFVDVAGVHGGLEITLLVEQHDYSFSSQRAAGVRLSVTDPATHGTTDSDVTDHKTGRTTNTAMNIIDEQDETERKKQQGPVYLMDDSLALPAGAATSVGLKVKKTADLQPPYGQCGERSLTMFHMAFPYTQQACHLDCLAQHLNRTCSCVEAYMPCAPGSCKSCTLLETLTCTKRETEEFFARGLTTQCDCPPQCFTTTYTPTLTSAPLSNVFINDLALGPAPVSPGNVSRSLAVQCWAQINRMNPRYTDLLEDVTVAIRSFVDEVKHLANTLSDLDSTLASLLEGDTCHLISKKNETERLTMGQKLSRCNQLADIIEYYECRYEAMMTTSPSEKDPFTLLSEAEASARSAKIWFRDILIKHALLREDWQLQLTLLTDAVQLETKSFAKLNQLSGLLQVRLEQYRSVAELRDVLFQVLNDTECEAMEANSTFALEVLGRLEKQVNTVQQMIETVHQARRVFNREAPLGRLYDVMQSDRAQVFYEKDEQNGSRSLVDREVLSRAFYESNILTVQVFVEEMTVQQTTKTAAYQAEALLCDIGGSLGLCLGGSVLTLIEVVDLVLTVANNRKNKKFGTDGPTTPAFVNNSLNDETLSAVNDKGIIAP